MSNQRFWQQIHEHLGWLIEHSEGEAREHAFNALLDCAWLNGYYEMVDPVLEGRTRYDEWVAAHPARARISFDSFCHARADRTLERVPVVQGLPDGWLETDDDTGRHDRGLSGKRR